jgi:hypothetical protein
LKHNIITIAHSCGVSNYKNGKFHYLIEGGKPFCFEWTPDFSVLVISWENDSFSSYSVYGNNILESPSDYVSDFLKVKNMQFGSDGFELFILSFQGNFYSIPFAKFAITTFLSPENVRNPLLLSEDRLFIYIGSNDDWSVETSSSWQTIPIPSLYLSDNWPINIVASNSSGSKFAVSGKKGFLIFNSRLSKWRLFGSHNYEQSFAVTAMAWIKDYIVVGCIVNSEKYALRVFDDKMILVGHKDILSRVCHMYSIDDHLTTYTEDGKVNHYLTVIGEDVTFQNIFVSDLGFDNPKHLQYVQPLLYPSGHNGEGPEFIVLYEGELFIYIRVNESDLSWKKIILDRDVEFCYVASDLMPSQNSVWSFSKRRVKIYLNTEINSDFNACQDEQFHLDFHFTPLGVLTSKGLVIGIDQHFASRGDEVLFKSNVQRSLVFQNIAGFLLSKKMEKEALTFVSKYQMVNDVVLLSLPTLVTQWKFCCNRPLNERRVS